MSDFDLKARLRERNQSLAELQQEIAGRTWYHTFDLGRGVRTPGVDPTPLKLPSFHIPNDLSGKSVLDIGAYDGFFSFECERRGAERVVAADHFVWTWEGCDARSNFEFMRELLQSSVEDRVIRVEDLSPDSIGTFDVVLFFGVLYHAPHPLLYLEHVRSVTRGVAIIETLLDALEVPYPVAACYAPDFLNKDASNHWGFNVPCVEVLLRRAGFSRVEFAGLWDRGTVTQLRDQPPAGDEASWNRQSGRGVFLAYV